MQQTTVQDLRRKHRNGETLTMLTAYDAPIARQVDRAGVDVILVGDTAADNHHGYSDTPPSRSTKHSRTPRPSTVR